MITYTTISNNITSERQEIKTHNLDLKVRTKTRNNFEFTVKHCTFSYSYYCIRVLTLKFERAIPIPINRSSYICIMHDYMS